MTKWLLRCTTCGNTWELEVSFDLTKLSSGKLYHYCRYCKRNTFHEILERVDEDGDAELGLSEPRSREGRPLSGPV
ncbi:hypothetical protein CF15_03595 [Pyrodictium occultum]|uniref:Uncharacterized protein n=1 Tax=Pyrodictium occultum TaxID=2309 RepID=A0A0V8RV17_PYROC|nr:hypothetical protein [Pyrodictium occultum]KSW11894.1 hypothetical protein CF15_03595 [Pyrodictium occultum]